MEDSVASTMADRRDVLLLAQQKLDKIDRVGLGLSYVNVGGGGGGRPGSTSSINKQRQRKSPASSQLLSTLLYVALMSHKLEDMKTMLEEEDPIEYLEWRCLLESLHSPEFHVRERMIQNGKVKLAFERKRMYKAEATRLGGELADTGRRLTELQKMTNETSNLLSKSINVLQGERAALVTTVEEGRCRIEEKNDKIDDLRMEAARNDVKSQSIRSELDSANLVLMARNRSISELEDKVSQFKQDAAFAMVDANHTRSTLEDVKAQLKACEIKFATYCAEKNPLISKLQQDLTDARSSNAVMNAKFEATKGSLDDTKQSLKECREIIARSNNLKDVVEWGLARLDDNMTRTGSLLSDALSVASNAASDTAISHERQLGQVLDVVSTLSSSTSLKSLSDDVQNGLLRVKRMVDDLEITNVEQRLKDLVMTQSNNLADVVKSSMSKLDDNMTESGSMLEESRDDLRILLSHSKEISDALSVASNAASDTAISHEQRLRQVIDVVSTLSSSTSLKSLSDDVQNGLLSVKRMVDDLEITNVEQRLKDLVMTQSNNLADVVKSSMSKLDDNMTESGSMLEESRDDLRILLSHSKEISDALSVASNAASDTAISHEQRLRQVIDVVSTLSSSTSLKSLSDDVQHGLFSLKRVVDDLSVALQQQRLEVLPQLKQKNSSQYQPVMNVEQSYEYFSLGRQTMEVVVDGCCDASRRTIPGCPGQQELIRANELADSFISEAVCRLANASQANNNNLKIGHLGDDSNTEHGESSNADSDEFHLLF